jgi:hypothetical protein
MRPAPQELKDPGELLRPLIEMGLVEVAVANDGEGHPRVRGDVTVDELLAAMARSRTSRPGSQPSSARNQVANRGSGRRYPAAEDRQRAGVS